MWVETTQFFMFEDLTDLLYRGDFVVGAVCYREKLFSSRSLSQVRIKEVIWLICLWHVIIWWSLNYSLGLNISNTTDNHNASHLQNGHMQLQVSNPPSITDPNMCHGHTKTCVHTHIPLTGVGCASSPPLGVQDPLPTVLRCGGCGCPQPHVIPGPHHLLPPAGGDPVPPGCGSRGCPCGELEVATGSSHEAGGWHCQALAEPRLPWGHVG